LEIMRAVFPLVSGARAMRLAMPLLNLPEHMARSLHSLAIDDVAGRFLAAYELFSPAQREALTQRGDDGGARVAIERWLAWPGTTSRPMAMKMIHIDARFWLATVLSGWFSQNQDCVATGSGEIAAAFDHRAPQKALRNAVCAMGARRVAHSDRRSVVVPRQSASGVPRPERNSESTRIALRPARGYESADFFPDDARSLVAPSGCERVGHGWA